MSQIIIDLEGADYKQTMRIKKILEILFDQRLFDFSNGNVVLHFDHEGTMRAIEWNKTKWRKEKFTLPLLINSFKAFHIESR